MNNKKKNEGQTDFSYYGLYQMCIRDRAYAEQFRHLAVRQVTFPVQRRTVAFQSEVSQWETKAQDLAQRFVKNFAKYEGNAAGKALVSAGPQL